MIKNSWYLLLSITLLFFGCRDRSCDCQPSKEYALQSMTDSLAEALDWPEDLKITAFTGPDLTPSPASMAVAATGEVFVGVDKIGSLGKEMGEGAIIRLQDCNHDGILDSHTEFARLDNPRGIIAMGDKVFVLHTTFSPETKKATGMDLVVFEDLDQDGVADGGPRPLIEDISSPKYLRARGTDHATNGIRMGIDGWIYIAVGDFGFYNATDRSGNKLTMLGGGIVRVRPDGTEMEVYTHGLRNIYDVAIDPFMNIFTRGNTNDGGGWNVRFADQIQTGEYGYPVLFKHFTEEIIPALIDVGGGSGTGALYMDDDRWPKKYNHVPMMADWGRSYLFMHHVNPDRGSFTQQMEQFIELPQITDVDIDAGGSMYLSAWNGAGYTGSPDIGYVVRVMPENFDYDPFPDLESASVKELVNYLKSSSAKARLYAQFELVHRSNEETSSAVWDVAGDGSLPRELQVAGIFTYAQIAGADGIDRLVSLTEDKTVREFALRALADRKAMADQVPLEPFLSALNDSSDRVKIAAIVGLGRLGRKEAAEALLQINVPDSFKSPEAGTEGPHATPHSELIPPHVAVRALVNLDAVDAVVDELTADNSELALWALRYMHDPKAVRGLIAAYEKSEDTAFKHKILNTLARLYHKEAPFDASWWWSTRPDTHGPYYKTVEWESSPVIHDFLINQQRKTEEDTFFTVLNSKYRLGIDAFGNVEEDQPKVDTPVVDLEKIKNKKGQIGESSIEDVMLALDKISGKPEKGKQLFVRQGCQVCHSVNKGEVMKGPFMGQIGGIMNKHQIAESILKPNASISQGFSTAQIETKNDNIYTGFITQESADELVLRDITGKVTKIKKSNIASRKELETSMMPTGMVNALSYEEFASLVAFLESQK